jgi:hypothetical protein
VKQSEAVRALGALAAAFRTTIPDETLAVWSTMLADVEAQDLGVAIGDLARGSRFLPSIAEILEECGVARRARLGGAEARAALPEVDGVTLAEAAAQDPDLRAALDRLHARGAPSGPVGEAFQTLDEVDADG